jgi:hypothetical protein
VRRWKINFAAAKTRTSASPEKNRDVDPAFTKFRMLFYFRPRSNAFRLIL